MQARQLLLLGALALTVACGGAPSDTDGEASPVSEAAAPAAEAPDPADDHSGHDHAAPAQGAEGQLVKNFPELEYLAQIPVAYRVANRHPELLSKIPCYCPCELYGHGGLIDCYRSQHAAACATCLEEAVVAGRLIEEAGHDRSQYEAVAAQVKNRYRTAIVRSYAQRGEMPDLQTAGGNAYLQVCSDCHQPPHPAMYQPESWRQPLARMEAYARQRGMELDPQLWSQAVDYVRSTSGRFPPEAGNQYRQSLAEQVEHLKVTEGDAAYYPSPQDEVLGPEWFDRMVRAYRLARDIPAEALAEVTVQDPACSNLLECLNGIGGLTSETAIDAVERLATQRGMALGND